MTLEDKKIMRCVNVKLFVYFIFLILAGMSLEYDTYRKVFMNSTQKIKLPFTISMIR